MSNSWSEDAGTIQVLLARLNSERLPRALELKSKVDRGERLDEQDMQFLQTVLEDASGVQHLAAKRAGFPSLVGRSTASTARSQLEHWKTNQEA